MSELFDKEGAPLYLLHTGLGTTKWGGDPVVLYDLDLSKEYKAIKEKYEKNALGNLRDGSPKIPEALHTKKMLEDSVVAAADNKGDIRTSNKEIAKRVLREFPDTVLDEASPQDILEELRLEQAEAKKSPAQKFRGR